MTTTWYATTDQGGLDVNTELAIFSSDRNEMPPADGVTVKGTLCADAPGSSFEFEVVRVNGDTAVIKESMNKFRMKTNDKPLRTEIGATYWIVTERV